MSQRRPAGLRGRVRRGRRPGRAAGRGDPAAPRPGGDPGPRRAAGDRRGARADLRLDPGRRADQGQHRPRPLRGGLRAGPARRRRRRADHLHRGRGLPGAALRSTASGGSAPARRPRPPPWPGPAPTRPRGSATGRCTMLADTIGAQLSSVARQRDRHDHEGDLGRRGRDAARGVPARRHVHHRRRRQRRHRPSGSTARAAAVAARRDLAGDAVAVAGHRGGPVLRPAGHDDAARRPRVVPAGHRPVRLRGRGGDDRRRHQPAVRRRRRDDHRDAGAGAARRRVRRGPRLPTRRSRVHPRAHPRARSTPDRRRRPAGAGGRQPARRDRPRGHPRRRGVVRGHPGLVRVRAGVDVPAGGVPVLVATSPISAAGLLADATAAWYWRGLRWAVGGRGA